MKREYISNPDCVISCEEHELLNAQDVIDAMNFANQAIFELSSLNQKYSINLFETLGMRNISGMVGEYFAKSIAKISEGKLVNNPHQDGFPDLLFNDTIRKKQYFNSLFLEKDGYKYPIEKEKFSQYLYGGIEIKSTCGCTPPTNLDKEIVKPIIGEQRVDKITQIDWRSHHRQTKRLLGVVWDFIDGVPTFVGAFFCDELNPDDWGKVSVPKNKNSRTTSVSIMNSSGVKKMCKHWVAIINDKKYINLFSRPKWIGYDVDNERLF